METVPTRRTPLPRQLAIGADDGIADGAFRLALEGARDVAPERLEAGDERVVGEGDGALGVDEPGLPFAVVDADALDALDGGVVERVRAGQPDGDLHALVVDRVGGAELFGFGRQLDLQGWRVGGVVGVLRGEPVGDGAEGGGDDVWAYLDRGERG